MSSPEQIQQQIEQTRASLSQGVDRLGEKVSPGRIVGRRVDRVKGSMSSARERVMGSRDDGTGMQGKAAAVQGSVQGAASSVSDAASGAMTSVSDAAGSAPQLVRQQTQGNPLAAGVIAFGVGWLLASLAPASDAERELARQTQDQATQLAEPLKEQARSMAEDLKEPVQDAVEQVKATATDAAGETADQAKSAAQDVRAPLQQ